MPPHRARIPSRARTRRMACKTTIRSGTCPHSAQPQNGRTAGRAAPFARDGARLAARIDVPRHVAVMCYHQAAQGAATRRVRNQSAPGPQLWVGQQLPFRCRAPECRCTWLHGAPARGLKRDGLRRASDRKSRAHTAGSVASRRGAAPPPFPTDLRLGPQRGALRAAQRRGARCKQQQRRH